MHTLTYKHVVRCADEIKDRAGLYDNLPAVQMLIEKDPEFEQMIAEYPEEGEGLDTYERDILLEYLAKELTGISWPCYGNFDNIDTDAWFEDLHRKGVEKGWKSVFQREVGA